MKVPKGSSRLSFNTFYSYTARLQKDTIWARIFERMAQETDRLMHTLCKTDWKYIKGMDAKMYNENPFTRIHISLWYFSFMKKEIPLQILFHF